MRITEFFRNVNPTYFAFLGGTGFSIAVNLYSSMVIVTELPPRWGVIAAAAACYACAGAFWTALSVVLTDLQNILKSAPRTIAKDDAVRLWDKIYQRRKKSLLSLSFGGLVVFAVGLAVSPFGPLFGGSRGSSLTETLRDTSTMSPPVVQGNETTMPGHLENHQSSEPEGKGIGGVTETDKVDDTK